MAKKKSKNKAEALSFFSGLLFCSVLFIVLFNTNEGFRAEVEKQSRRYLRLGKDFLRQAGTVISEVGDGRFAEIGNKFSNFVEPSPVDEYDKAWHYAEEQNAAHRKHQSVPPAGDGA
jgi:hypothetical protein